MPGNILTDQQIADRLPDNATGLIDAVADIYATLNSRTSSMVYCTTMQELIDAYALHGGSKVYVPVGMIDAGSLSLELTDENFLLTGDSYFNSGIYSTADNHTIFKNAAGEFCSNIDIRGCSFYASGSNSKIMDLDGAGNAGAIEFSSCNIGDFAGATTEIGTLANFRQFKTQNCGFFRINDGLTFEGTWSGGFRISESIVLSQAISTTLFKAALGLTFAGRCISDINAASADPTTITFDFVPANFLLDGGFQLTGASFAPNSSISVTTDEDSIKAFFRDCVEIRNTHPGFEMEFTTEAVTALTVDTPAKVAGTTTTTRDTWWTQTGNNEVTYNSNLIKDFRITVNMRIDGGSNDLVAVYLRQWDNSASAYIDLKVKALPITNLIGGLDVQDYNFTTVGEFHTNDRIEVWVENQTKQEQS